MKIIHCVYVIKSLKDDNFYVGRTENLKQRLIDHGKGKVPKHEGSETTEVYVEKYLKTSWGKRYLKHRLKNDDV